MIGDVLFATLHVVGSNNGLGHTAEGDAEYAERNAANLAWLQQAFELAKKNEHKALVLMCQANPNFAAGAGGFQDFLAALEAQMSSYQRQVLFVHAHRGAGFPAQCESVACPQRQKDSLSLSYCGPYARYAPNGRGSIARA